MFKQTDLYIAFDDGCTYLWTCSIGLKTESAGCLFEHAIYRGRKTYNERWTETQRTKIENITGGNLVIILKGGIPKKWEKPFCFYY
jgi:hypothetical protein